MAQPALKKAHIALRAPYPAIREDEKLPNFKTLASPMTSPVTLPEELEGHGEELCTVITHFLTFPPAFLSARSVTLTNMSAKTS